MGISRTLPVRPVAMTITAVRRPFTLFTTRPRQVQRVEVPLRSVPLDYSDRHNPPPTALLII